MNRRIVRLLIAAAAAILSASCTPGGGSIYWTLENEVPVDDLSLPNDINVFDVTKIGSSYYAAAGKIWTVADAVLDAAGGQWDVTALVDSPNPGVLCTELCTALVASPFGTNTLYGGFINASGNLGLFESTAAPSFAGRTVETLPVAGAQVALIKVVNDGSDRLIVVTTHQPSAGADFIYGIVYSASAGSYAAATFDTTRPAGDEEKPINDVIYAGGAINAWFATEGTKLYTNSGPGFAGDFTLAGMTGITAGEVLSGLFWDGTTRVYVASRAGAVYYSTDGTTWTRIEAPTITGAHPPLTRFVGPFGDDEKSLLVGSDGYGIYRLPTSPIGSLARDETSGLKSSAVMKLMLDAAQSRVFAGTSMGGLWRGAVSVVPNPDDVVPPIEMILKIVWNQE